MPNLTRLGLTALIAFSFGCDTTGSLHNAPDGGRADVGRADVGRADVDRSDAGSHDSSARADGGQRPQDAAMDAGARGDSHGLVAKPWDGAVPDGVIPPPPVFTPPPPRAGLLAVNAGFTRIVATLYSAGDASGQNSCLTARDSQAAAAGYFDLGNYSGCSATNEPLCRNGARKVVLAMTNLPNGSVKYHTACVLSGQPRGSAIVATLYSATDAAGNATCLTGRDAAARQAGYWDLAQYGACVDNTPQCRNGARKIVMAMTSQPDGSVKYHNACFIDDQAQATRIVATLHSRSLASGQNECVTGRDPEGPKRGLWDLGQYGACNAQNEPTCQNGSRKLVTAMTSLADGSTQYHTACVIAQSPLAENWVATLYRKTDAGGSSTCLTASSALAKQVGYWDLAGVGYCVDKQPRCELGAKVLTISTTRLPNGSVKSQHLCVLPEMIEAPAQPQLATAFRDGKTLVVFAHQDDDLLWMLPLWGYASQFLLAAYPIAPAYQRVIDEHAPGYRSRWSSLWGQISEKVLSEVYFEPCVREGIVSEAELTRRLEPHIKAAHVARIVTHNPWGEYGHHQHRRVGKVVRDLAIKHKKDVWALSARASTAPNSGYSDITSLKLPTIWGHYDHGELMRLRRVYQQTSILLRGNPHDLWTWHDAELDYPHGRRPYVQLIAAGRDLVAGHAAIATLQREVPRSGHCQ